MSTFMQQIPSSLKEDTIYVCERSIHSSFNVFSKLLNLKKEDLFMLQHIYDGYAKGIQVKGIIYIQSSVEDCLRRAEQRNYSADRLLTQEYLKRVDCNYMDWLKKTNIPVYNTSDSEIRKIHPNEVLVEAFKLFNI